jgi:hypothetical protein
LDYYITHAFSDRFKGYYGSYYEITQRYYSEILDEVFVGMFGTFTTHILKFINITEDD